MNINADNAMKLLEVLEKELVPFGKLTTYKSVGEVLGIKAKEAGVACRILGECDEAKEIPYHRIIKREGWLPVYFSAGGTHMHIKLLEQEGHKVEEIEGKHRVIDFEDYLLKL